MKKINTSFEYTVYNDMSELIESDQELLLAAINQLPKAYAPYSKFHVGAAIRLADRSIYVGCNQENASYPLCMCAERVALYRAAAVKPNTAVEAMAITIKNQKSRVEKMISPCGACRQVILEFEHRYQQPIRIILKSESDEIYEFNSIKTLLPLSFDGTFL